MGYYVYQLRLENSESPFYIGKGRGRRMLDHFKNSELKKRSHKNNVINKAIREGVEVLREVLYEGLTEEQAHAKEIELIALYGRRVNGGCLTNATDGGEGVSGYKPSPETRIKLSVAQTGKRHAESVKLKMSYSRLGLKKSPEHAKAISTANSGKKKSPEHIIAAKFSKWDNNPAWKNADQMHDAWMSLGKPSRKKFNEFVGGKTDKLWTASKSGWIPRNDDEWKRYKGI